MNSRRFTVVSISLALVASAGLLTAGPLTPPAGPVASSFKTLSEVEPRTPIDSVNTPGDADAQFKITSPGSYYATGSMTVGSGRAYLEIAASGVTVDLSGFRIAGSAGSLDGVFLTNSGVSNVTIRNGTIASFADGVDFTNSWGDRIESVRFASCVGNAVVTGPSTVLRDCQAISCGGNGFVMGAGSMANECMARGCENGFYGGGAMSRCSSASNTGAGFYLTAGGAVERCETSGNSIGVDTYYDSTNNRIVDCTLSYDATHGIRVAKNALVRGNSIVCGNNMTCIWVEGRGNRIEGNTTRTTGNAIDNGMDATDNLVIGNWHFSGGLANGFANFTLGGNMVGPVVTGSGTITSTNPWTNFSR